MFLSRRMAEEVLGQGPEGGMEVARLGEELSNSEHSIRKGPVTGGDTSHGNYKEFGVGSVSLRVQTLPSYEDTSQIDLGPP